MYYNPLKVIASVQGSGSSSVPPIVSDKVPEYNDLGGDLMLGDMWWDPINEYLYVWLSSDNGIEEWIPVGGRGYITELISEMIEENEPPDIFVDGGVAYLDENQPFDILDGGLASSYYSK